MRTVDLFAGCGGLSLGFQNAGFDIVAAFENWGHAADCYEANLDHPVLRIDLGDVEAAISLIKPLCPEAIIGGPPCQDFSHAGKKREAERASLTVSFAEIVCAVRPRLFVMENVGVAQRSEAYASARTLFERAGYGLTEKVMTASYCGVPQRRKRLFAIGLLGGSDGEFEAALGQGLSDRETTVREYADFGIDYYYQHPRNYGRRGIHSVDEPAPTVRGQNRPLPANYVRHRGDASPVFEGLRALTSRERATVQTFPPDFVFSGCKTVVEQMIGNAVPPKLAEYVANAVLGHLGGAS